MPRAIHSVDLVIQSHKGPYRMLITRRSVLLACPMVAVALIVGARGTAASQESAWLRACSLRFQQRALMPPAEANQLAEVCLEVIREVEGISNDRLPEMSGIEAADEELGYWHP